MKQSLILLICTVIIATAQSCKAPLSLSSIPTAENMDKKKFQVKIEADDWHMVDIPTTPNPSQQFHAFPINGNCILDVNMGKIILSDVNLEFEMPIPVMKNGVLSYVNSKVHVEGINKNPYLVNNKVINYDEGKIEADGFFYLPWLVNLKFDAFPNEKYKACVLTWGFLGNNTFGNQTHYSDIGLVLDLQPLGPNPQAVPVVPVPVGPNTLRNANGRCASCVQNCCNSKMSEAILRVPREYREEFRKTIALNINGRN